MANLNIQRGRGALAAPTREEFDPFRRMRELMGFDPLAELTRSWTAGSMDFIPAFEVKENKDAYIFKADLPGVEEKDLEITLTGDRLTVSGHRSEEKKEDNERYYTYERSFGSFSRSFTLPEGVDAEQCQADLKDGVLTLSLPKKPEVKPKKISLGSGEKKAKA